MELSGHLYLTSLDIRDRQHEKLFFLPLMQVDIAPTRPLAKDIQLSALHVYNLEVSLNRDRQGVWNHSRMAMNSDQPAKPGDRTRDRRAKNSTPVNLSGC